MSYADPNCKTCKGTGWLYAESMITRPGERGGGYCACARDNVKIMNMEKVWKSLGDSFMPAALRDDPPLLPYLKKNIWITANEKSLRAHLKALAFRMPSHWEGRVHSDKDLLKAWLNTAYAQGHRIYDTELEESMVTVRAMYVDELVEPPELLILILGVKQAPNKETPTVLLEAIRTRLHIGRPLWIVDQPDRPVDHVEHRAYSEQLEGILAQWPHFRLKMREIQEISPHTVTRSLPEIEDFVVPSEPEPKDSGADSGSDPELGSLLDELVNRAPKKKRFKKGNWK